MSTRTPAQWILDEIDRLFDEFSQSEHYTDDSIFDDDKFDVYLKEHASKEAYKHWMDEATELIRE